MAILRIIFIIIMTMMCIGCTFQNGDTVNKIEIGSYIQFGKYYEKPILWRVINIDDNGNPMIFSERALCLKAFTGEQDINNRAVDVEDNSTYWGDSNIRQWLNSSEDSITWERTPPQKNNVFENPYENEPGFLHDSNFTKEERKMILPHKHDVLLAKDYAEYRDGGSTYFYDIKFNRVDAVEEKYNDIYFQIFTDKVFFLSTVELKKYVMDRGWEVRKKPTKEALENDMNPIKDKTRRTDEYMQYWLETPTYANVGVYVIFADKILNDPMVGNCITSSGHTGVCPAMVLKRNAFEVKEGKGTIRKPFKIVSSS